MSDILGELERVRRAYETPTLSLLKRRSEVVIAIFRSTFTRDARAVPAARFHEQVDAYLQELRMQGIDGVSSGTGRDVAREWVRGQWLVRNPEEDGTESYSLTSHARDALEIVARRTRERTALSEHRITTIVSTVQRFNADINPDRSARIDILDREIAEREAERERLLTGGEITAASPDQVVSGFGEILDLISDLPGDFARVQEAFARLRQVVLADFRNETRPAGEVIDAYLRRADEVTTATVEGRSFEGAFALLRDQALLATLRENLTDLLTHPMAADVLLDADRQELRGLVALIRTGMETVLSQRKKVTTTLREYIVTHDAATDRELDTVLRQLDTEITNWMRGAGARAIVPLALLPAPSEVEGLRERFHDAAEDTPPVPLADLSGQDLPAVSLEELRAQGGPSFELLRPALQAALERDSVEGESGPESSVATLGSVFAGLTSKVQRPVEIFGLLQLATQEETVIRSGDDEEYMTVRPDGTRRLVRVPTLAWALPAATEIGTNGHGQLQREELAPATRERSPEVPSGSGSRGEEGAA